MQKFVLELAENGIDSRHVTCDTYVLTYWMYKHKLLGINLER